MELLLKNFKTKVVFGIILVFVLSFFYLKQKPLFNEKDLSMKIASSFTGNSHDLDPAKILYQNEYMILDNIYSPLVEYSTEGKLVSGIAEKFEWDKNTAVFKIRKDIKTITGQEIDAEDAAMSLKRLLILQSNTHGDLKQMLCQGLKLTKLSDPCPGIAILDRKTLLLKFPKKEFFLFPKLTAIDFAVIPKKAINPASLKIIDYKNTSGPYYIYKDLGDGRIELRTNTFHYHFSNKIPQKTTLIPSGLVDSKESISLFSKGAIDHITTKDPSAWMPHDYAKTHKNTELHKTHPIHMYVVVFTDKGMTRLSREERFFIGRNLKLLFLRKYLQRPGYQETSQIIPLFGEGRLSRNQEAILAQNVLNIKKKVLTKHFTCWNYFGAEKNDLKTFFPKGKFIWSSDIPTPANNKYDELPDCYLYQGDASFYEDIGFISYYINISFWDIPENKKSIWLENYEAASSRKDRLNLLKSLHFSSLDSGKIFPIAFRPYYALVRKPWKMDFPLYFAKNPLWKISKN